MNGPMSVSVCADEADKGYDVLALRYFLYPIPVEPADKNWMTATHGAVFPNWEKAASALTCNGKKRQGDILGTFPFQSFAVRFTHSPP